ETYADPEDHRGNEHMEVAEPFSEPRHAPGAEDRHYLYRYYGADQLCIAELQLFGAEDGGYHHHGLYPHAVKEEPPQVAFQHGHGAHLRKYFFQLNETFGEHPRKMLFHRGLRRRQAGEGDLREPY